MSRYWVEKRNEEKARQKRLAEERKIRRANIEDFWMRFTKYFRPWLHELTRKYKEKGEFPVMAEWLLPSYYTDTKDIEIAAFAAILINNDERMMVNVAAFRVMMGDSPFAWFRAREFVSLSMGEVQEKRTGGVLNSTIAEYFNTIYVNWKDRKEVVSIILTQFFKDRYFYKLSLLRLVLEASDGFGKGVWATDPHDIKCPLTGDVKRFLKQWTPFYNYRGGIRNTFSDDEIVRMFGFEHDYDLYYAVLAYQELCRINPKGCSRLATLYQKRYDEGNILGAMYWTGNRGILPEIDFGAHG